MIDLSGASMPSDEGYFYSYEAGYVIADNRGDGNTLDHRIRVYDENLNLILEVEGYGDTFTDEVTGEHYLSYISDGVTTVFSLDRCEEMFTLDGDCGYYVTWAYDGAFVLTDRDNYNIYDPDGEVVFSCSINR